MLLRYGASVITIGFLLKSTIPSITSFKINLIIPLDMSYCITFNYCITFGNDILLVEKYQFQNDLKLPFAILFRQKPHFPQTQPNSIIFHQF